MITTTQDGLTCRRTPPCWNDRHNGYTGDATPATCCCNSETPLHCGLWLFTVCMGAPIDGCKTKIL